MSWIQWTVKQWLAGVAILALVWTVPGLGVYGASIAQRRGMNRGLTPSKIRMNKPPADRRQAARQVPIKAVNQGAILLGRDLLVDETAASFGFQAEAEEQSLTAEVAQAGEGFDNSQPASKEFVQRIPGYEPGPIGFAGSSAAPVDRVQFRGLWGRARDRVVGNVEGIKREGKNPRLEETTYTIERVEGRTTHRIQILEQSWPKYPGEPIARRFVTFERDNPGGNSAFQADEDGNYSGKDGEGFLEEFAWWEGNLENMAWQGSVGMIQDALSEFAREAPSKRSLMEDTAPRLFENMRQAWPHHIWIVDLFEQLLQALAKKHQQDSAFLSAVRNDELGTKKLAFARQDQAWFRKEVQKRIDPETFYAFWNRVVERVVKKVEGRIEHRGNKRSGHTIYAIERVTGGTIHRIRVHYDHRDVSRFPSFQWWVVFEQDNISIEVDDAGHLRQEDRNSPKKVDFLLSEYKWWQKNLEQPPTLRGKIF
ncbi:MAG: hypothetical protein A3J74_05545 [Elusimicrobia bacterium RIFCSPHIGHO2_02_FULL_57_9]|nr:MAG: hypothetical protein A3J74_05545 [Elusimicrobia bacterium RIFCSPHIGHO2_02_FULL_57_9]